MSRFAMASSRQGGGFIYARQTTVVLEKSAISRLLSADDTVLAGGLAARGFQSI
jgi:hypothetical protein